MEINTLTQYLAQILHLDQFKDYCPNGLQVEGRAQVHTIVTGVTANMALLERAHALKADAILVHHGYFWRGEASEIVGLKQKRIQFLLKHDINLLAYHLPLDAHPELGNNAQLGKQLNIPIIQRTGENNLIAIGQLEKPMRLQDWADFIAQQLGRTPMVIGEPERKVARVAWCTGAAQDYMETALNDGIDAFLSGEISERTVHLARESGVAYVAAGHHATERYGVQALGAHLAQQFGVAHAFVEIDNPV